MYKHEFRVISRRYISVHALIYMQLPNNETDSHLLFLKKCFCVTNTRISCVTSAHNAQTIQVMPIKASG
jgi:hypothetical protein